MNRWLGAIAVTTLVTACAGPDMMYYTLSPVAMTTPPAVVWTQPYRIGTVTVPAQVDDATLIVRTSPDQMMVLSYDRWSATLSEQFRDALSQALTQQLGMPPMQNLASGPALRDTTLVTVDVQRFELIPGQEALLEAIWRISPPSSATSGKTLTCYSVLRSESGVGVAALVAAQQRNLMVLSQQIAQAMRTGHQAKVAPGINNAIDMPKCY